LPGPRGAREENGSGTHYTFSIKLFTGALDVLLTAESQMFLAVHNATSGAPDIVLDTQFQLNITSGQCTVHYTTSMPSAQVS